jgi:hypothetical protein
MQKAVSRKKVSGFEYSVICTTAKNEAGHRRQRGVGEWENRRMEEGEKGRQKR